MKPSGYRRRRFLERCLAVAGGGLSWRALAVEVKNPEETQPLTADQALVELRSGNQRYVTGTNQHHDYGPERESLALSQKPFAVIVGCSDSRVSPELAFDQSRGRLFVIRIAGNFVDDNGLASTEYGVGVLGASLVVVLGHTECGAIKATIDVITKGKELPGHLPGLISHLRKSTEKALAAGGSVEAAIRENVAANVAALNQSSPLLAPLIQKQQVKVVGAIYDLLTGEVRFQN